jgi:acetyltransferase-like isoleucine patch superfamily enzyme
VIIEDHAYIGSGAVIRPGTKSKPLVIGSHSIIGMGAIVTKSVLHRKTVFDNPAKVLGR